MKISGLWVNSKIRTEKFFFFFCTFLGRAICESMAISVISRKNFFGSTYKITHIKLFLNKSWFMHFKISKNGSKTNCEHFKIILKCCQRFIVIVYCVYTVHAFSKMENKYYFDACPKAFSLSDTTENVKCKYVISRFLASAIFLQFKIFKSFVFF